MLILVVFLITIKLGSDTLNIKEISSVDNNNYIIQKNNLNSNLSIAIFYDDNYTSPWTTYSEALAYYLNNSFSNNSINCNIYDGVQLLNFLNTHQIGILVVPMGIIPNSIWNGSEDSKIEQWLDNGGIIIWTGCEEFYWISYPNGTNVPFGHDGSAIVLDMEYLEVRSDQYVSPTSLGEYYMSNITAHTTDIFTSLSLLNANSIYYEAYCQNGDLADPILFQPKNGNGYFIRVHSDWIDTLDAETIGDWISSLVVKRFLSHPIITKFEYMSEFLIYNSINLNISLSNYYNMSFNCTIKIDSELFEYTQLNFILKKFEFNKSINLIINCRKNAIIKNTSIILSIIINKSIGSNELQIYYRNLTIHTLVPYEINFYFLPTTIYPGGNINIYIFYTSYYNYSINLSLLIYSYKNIYQVVNFNNIHPGLNQLVLPISISWTSISGNVSVNMIIYYNLNPIGNYQFNIIIHPIYENPYFIFMVIIVCIIIIVAIAFYYKFKKRGKYLQTLIKSELKKVKVINRKEFCNKVNIGLKKFEFLIKEIIKKDKKFKYLLKNPEGNIVILNKIEFQDYLKNIIKDNDNITFSQLKEMVYLTSDELKFIINKFI